MFAGAAREVVFSNPAVVRRVNAEFIPVALKAALVNNPPRGVEGELYAEIGRSKPAPQGICTVNSAGKVLTWALSFDDDKSILKFLDHVVERYKQFPDAGQPVIARRYMKFPSHQLADVEDIGGRLAAPSRHVAGDRCPGQPTPEKGTLAGRIIGRPLDASGKPIADTIRQEHYMEARFEIPIGLQEQLARAVRQADGKRFPLPDGLIRSLVGPAYLGQLDVNPLGLVPGSRNEVKHWEFFGQLIPSDVAGEGVDSTIKRIRIVGQSYVEGEQNRGRDLRTDGRLWEHWVALHWQGYVDLEGDRVTQMVMVADGQERLRWGNRRFQLLTEPDVAHLMAGHPIDLKTKVRYGLIAKPWSTQADPPERRP